MHAELIAIRSQLQALREIPGQLAEMRAAVAREQERAAFREDIIDRLHTENQQLRRSEVESTLDPVRAGLYRLYDLARREADRWMTAGQEETDPPASSMVAPSERSLFAMFSKQVGALFTAFAEEVVEVLGRTGVEPFEVTPGERYDVSLHRPVDTVEVSDPTWDGAVIETVSSGFVRGEQIARRADVVVGQLTGR
jgi:hypothetical protein